MPLTKEQIVIETIEYYKTQPRATITDETGVNICKYYNNGAMCAVGRCLKNPKDFANIDEAVNSDELFDICGQTILSEKYQGHENTFWSNLQELHDTNNHWYIDDDTNLRYLTDEGYSYVKNVICDNHDIDFGKILNALYNDTTEMQLN